MLTAIRQWVVQTMMKGQTGVVRTLPKPQIIELNTQITAERMMRNGINPNDMKTVGQVENVVKQIDTPKVNVNPGITSIKKADVMDMEGNKIPEGSKIMGGKAVPGTSDREKVRNEMKKKYGFTDERLDEIENTQFDEKIGDDLLREDDERIIKERLEKQNKDSVQRFKNKMDDPEEFADGGRIGLLAGSVPKVLKLLKNKKRVQQAVDDIFPTGDYKYDAQMAADALVENNPKTFGGKLYEDLDMDTQMEVYGAVLQPITNNMAKQMQLKRATRPEKTLASMEEGKGIDMSDPGISEEFTRFMKETDPEGYKKLEQTVELSNFDPKGRKKNATGGRIGLFMGSRPATQKGLAALREMLNFFGKKSDSVKNPSDILRIVNPKRLNQMLEDPNIYRKFDVKKGIAAPDLIKNMQKQMNVDRKKTIEEMLGAAKNIRKADENTIKYKNEMIEEMIKKGADEETAKGLAQLMTNMAEDAAGKMPGAPKLTKEGVDQLELILRDMETGGKKPRELNATGGRIGYKDGPGMNRRTFLKLLGGLASLPIIGKIVKPLKTVKGIKNVPIVKTADVPGKPEWFDSLVNKVILEGDDVTKKLATQDRQVVYSKKIDADNEVTVYRDLDTDSIRVDYSSPDVMLDEPVSLSYTRGQADEATQGMKPADEFETYEQGFVGRANGPDDYSIDVEPNVGSSISSLETDVSKLKEYATGKGPTMKEFIASKKRKDRVRKINEGDIGETSDYVTKKQGDYVDYDDYASGGIARMLGE